MLAAADRLTWVEGDPKETIVWGKLIGRHMYYVVKNYRSENDRKLEKFNCIGGRH